MFFLQAIFKLIPKDEVPRLPADENTAEKRAEKLWKFFDKGENGEGGRGGTKATSMGCRRGAAWTIM